MAMLALATAHCSGPHRDQRCQPSQQHLQDSNEKPQQMKDSDNESETAQLVSEQ